MSRGEGPLSGGNCYAAIDGSVCVCVFLSSFCSVSRTHKHCGENRLVPLHRPKGVIFCTTPGLSALWSDGLFDLFRVGWERIGRC